MSHAGFNDAVRLLADVGEKTIRGQRYWTGIGLAST